MSLALRGNLKNEDVKSSSSFSSIRLLNVVGNGNDKISIQIMSGSDRKLYTDL